jgi:hypothetical protein
MCTAHDGQRDPGANEPSVSSLDDLLCALGATCRRRPFARQAHVQAAVRLVESAWDQMAASVEEAEPALAQEFSESMYQTGCSAHDLKGDPPS